MTTTQSSRRAVFRHIAQTSYYEWPTYTDTPLYDRSSTGGLAEDVRILAGVWFDHDSHESIKEFVCHWPLAYVEFDAHDRYAGHTRYEMEQLFRVFLIKALHGWAHETALVTHLEAHPSLRQRLEFQTVPDQSTLWRTWQYRFTSELREFIAAAARTILVKAEAAGVAVPEAMEGESLLPVVSGGESREDVFVQISESKVGRALRTGRWTYVVRDPEMNGSDAPSSDRYVEQYLFDLDADPYQQRNLAGHDRYHDVADGLRDRLRERIETVEGETPAIEPPGP